MNSINGVVSIDDRRVFIDIAKSGCGSGCRYCYVDTAMETQQLWDWTQIDSAITVLEEMPQFKECPSNFIVTLCPSTEPLRSNASYELVELIMHRLIPYGCFIQIATKEVVNDSFLRDMDGILLFDGQMIINTSITTIMHAVTLEPKAPTPFMRIKNISSISKTRKIKSCVLIKPFMQTTYNELDSFKLLINHNKPDYICAGIYFNSNCSKTEENDSVFYNMNYSSTDKMILLQYMHELGEYIKMPVYPSSLCAINQIMHGFVKPVASTTALCRGCGMCKNEEG